MSVASEQHAESLAPPKEHWWDKLTPEEKQEMRLRRRLKNRIKTSANSGTRLRAMTMHYGMRISLGGRRERMEASIVMSTCQHERESARRESRCCNLAYAFLRGKPWVACEQKYYTIPNTQRIGEIIGMHTVDEEQVWRQKMASWIDDAIKSGGYVGKVGTPSQANPGAH